MEVGSDSAYYGLELKMIPHMGGAFLAAQNMCFSPSQQTELENDNEVVHTHGFYDQILKCQYECFSKRVTFLKSDKNWMSNDVLTMPLFFQTAFLYKNHASSIYIMLFILQILLYIMLLYICIKNVKMLIFQKQ